MTMALLSGAANRLLAMQSEAGVKSKRRFVPALFRIAQFLGEKCLLEK